MEKICDNFGCFNNDHDNLFMCLECLDKFLMNNMSVDDISEMYLETQSMFADGSFQTFVKEVLVPMEVVEGDEETIDKSLSDFKENLSEIYNNILLRRIAKDQ